MKLGKKTIVLLGIPLGLGLAGGLAAIVLLGGSGSTPPITPDPSPGQHGLMVPLEEKVVNLMDGGDYRYAKIGVTVEVRPEKADYYALVGEARAVADKELLKEFEPAMPLMLDALGRVVGSHTSTELGTPEGREALKAELMAEMKHVLGEEEVLDLYFTDMVMQ